MNLKRCLIILLLAGAGFSCKKNSDPENQNTDQQVPPSSYTLSSLKVNGTSGGFTYYGVDNTPDIRLSFSAPLNTTSVQQNIQLKDASGLLVPVMITSSNGDSSLSLCRKAR
jgi:hypothetical protein